jgi:hypothetical protein
VKVGALLAHLGDLERSYAETLRHSAERYQAEHDVFHQCLTFAAAADKAATRLEEIRQRYDGTSDWHVPLARDGNTLLEDLRSLYLMADAVAVTWTMALQAAKALRDSDLNDVASTCHTDAETQAKWLLTRIKTGAPQALVVA